MAEICHLDLDAKMQKRDFLKKLSNLQLWCLLTTYRKSYVGFSKNPLLDLKNPRWRRSAISKINMTSFFFCRGWSDLDKILQTGAEWQVDCGDVAKMETRSRILIWRTFGRIQWHVIPEPPVTLQGGATWWVQCRDPWATCHIAGCYHWANSLSWFQSRIAACCHLANSMTCHPRVTLQGRLTSTCWMSRSQSHMPHCRVQSPGEINVMIVRHWRV